MVCKILSRMGPLGLCATVGPSSGSGGGPAGDGPELYSLFFSLLPRFGRCFHLSSQRVTEATDFLPPFPFGVSSDSITDTRTAFPILTTFFRSCFARRLPTDFRSAHFSACALSRLFLLCFSHPPLRVSHRECSVGRFIARSS